MMPNAGPLQDITVLTAGASLHDSGILWPNVSSTLGAALAALALSALVGTPFGVLLGMLPRAWQVLGPYLNALNSMPRIALAPVFVVLLGIGQSSKIAVGFSVAVFIFMMNARAGVLSADDEHRRVCLTLGASKAQLFWKLYLPVALPRSTRPRSAVSRPSLRLARRTSSADPTP